MPSAVKKSGGSHTTMDPLMPSWRGRRWPRFSASSRRVPDLHDLHGMPRAISLAGCVRTFEEFFARGCSHKVGSVCGGVPCLMCPRIRLLYLAPPLPESAGKGRR